MCRILVFWGDLSMAIGIEPESPNLIPAVRTLSSSSTQVGPVNLLLAAAAEQSSQMSDGKRGDLPTLDKLTRTTKATETYSRLYSPNSNAMPSRARLRGVYMGHTWAIHGPFRVSPLAGPPLVRLIRSKPSCVLSVKSRCNR